MVPMWPNTVANSVGVYDTVLQAACCEHSSHEDNNASILVIVNNSATVGPAPQCHCPPCLDRAENHLNGVVKTVGTLGLVFSLTEVPVGPFY